jgi:hypothetical protein
MILFKWADAGDSLVRFPSIFTVLDSLVGCSEFVDYSQLKRSSVGVGTCVGVSEHYDESERPVLSGSLMRFPSTFTVIGSLIGCSDFAD